MNQKLSSLSVALPCFNEEALIAETLDKAHSILTNFTDKLEVIVVNDGSTDESLNILLEAKTKYPNLTIVNAKHAGYGSALRQGFSEAKMEWIFITDSDQQFDLNEFSKLSEHSDNSDFIIGYRAQQEDGKLRGLMRKSWRFYSLIMAGLSPDIRDPNCAFKLINQKALLKCLPLISDGALISTELLSNASKNNIQIVQIPVSHFPRKSGIATGGKPSVVIKAVYETLKLWRFRMKKVKA